MIYFTTGGHPHFIGRTEDIRIRIHHRSQDNYPLAANGQEIKEELPLREFVDRLHRDGTRHDIERTTYEILKHIQMPEQNSVKAFCHYLDSRYAELFRRGKLVLPQHKMSTFEDKYRGYVDPFGSPEEQRYRRMQMEQQMAMRDIQARHPGQFIPVTSSEAKEIIKKKSEDVSDEDIYYLLT